MITMEIVPESGYKPNTGYHFKGPIDSINLAHRLMIVLK